MKRALHIAAGIALTLSGVVGAAEGLVTIQSAHSVSETATRLEKSLSAADFQIFARVDHAAGAERVNMTLAPTELLIFGKPDVGTLLMQSAPTIGIDLPLKYLVWQEASGNVMIGWNDPAWLVQRHEIADRDKVVTKMTAALQKFAAEAAKP